MSEDGRKLDRPAQVGNAIFHAGVSERLVIERAQREYDYQQTPENEAARMERVRAFQAAVSVPDREALEEAAKLLEQWSEEIRSPCSGSDGDFSCEDCPASNEQCREDWQRIVDNATALRALAARLPAEPASLPEAAEHVCGLQGYNPMIDPPCPGCEKRAKLLRRPSPTGNVEPQG